MNPDPGLYAAVHECRRCPLWAQRGDDGMAVPAEVGSGYEPGGLAIMCEAPGYYENQSGRPLVGKAGQTLDSILELAGMQRSDLLIVNRVRCRPPNNRLQDYPEAVHACDHWTTQELTVYNPRVVVLMGATALRAVFGAQSKVTVTRGSFASRTDRHEWGARVYTATYHPSAATRSGGANGNVGRLIRDDLREAHRVWSLLRG